MKGTKGPDRKSIGMIDELIVNKRYGDLKRRAEDRQGWRKSLQSATCRLVEH